MEREATEETFTYDLAIPISRRTTGDVIWYIIEKGIYKSKDEAYKNCFSASKIRSALSDIRKHITKIPMSKEIETENDTTVILLDLGEEFNQIMNSIQARGVVYTLLQLSDEQKRKGVIAISPGHFAHILSYFGKKFGIPVTVVMPSSTVQETVDKCRDLSATVIVRGYNMADVHEIALQYARTKGLVYLDEYDHPNMIIGQATLGIEIIEQIMDIDVIILPAILDGCGITAGIAVAIRESNPNIKIIEVQIDLKNFLIDDARKKMTKEPIELNISTKCSEAYVNSKTIQKGLFDLTILIDNKEVHDANIFLKSENIEDYYRAIASAGIRSRRLDDFINGKRVLLPFFGKTDLSMFALNEKSFEPREPRRPSTSSS